MASGAGVVQERFESPRVLLGDRLREGSIYRLLADEGDRLFGDDYFADLYRDSARGRPTIPARVMATTMLLQAFEGLSDAEACDRLEVDLRWQAAAGVHCGYEGFHPTSLVGQRNRLRASTRPRRLFEDTKVAARQAGALQGRARVLDSTPVYDAVATQDTVTQLRAAIRQVLATLDHVDPPLAARVRAVLERDDDYATAGEAAVRLGRPRRPRGAGRRAGARRGGGVGGARRRRAGDGGPGRGRPVGVGGRPGRRRRRRRDVPHRAGRGPRPGDLDRRP